MKRLYFFILLISSVCSQTTQAQDIFLQNPGFEGTPGIGRTPPNWQVCNLSPDTQPCNPPICWDVSKRPKEGRSYIGMIGLERIGQNLARPLDPGDYAITVWLAYQALRNFGPPAYPVNGYVELVVYGSNGTASCRGPASGRTELTRVRVDASEPNWKQYTLSFHVPLGTSYTYFSFGTVNEDAYDYLLMDDIGPIHPAVCDDAAKPIIIQKNDQTNVPAELGLCDAAVVGLAAVAINCPGATKTWELLKPDGSTVNGTDDIPEGTRFDKGTTICTYRVTTATGTVSDPMVFRITVIDTEVPRVILPASSSAGITRPVAGGTCTAFIAVDDAQPWDNCPEYSLTWAITGATVMSSGPAAGGLHLQLGTKSFKTGKSTVTYTATDAAGLTATASFEVTVTNEAPILTKPSDVVIQYGRMSTYYGELSSADYDPNGDSFSYIVLGPMDSLRTGDRGAMTFSVLGEAKYRYILNRNHIGWAGFQYVARDACGAESAVAEIRFHIPNTKPVINPNIPDPNLLMGEEPTLSFDLRPNVLDEEENVDFNSLTITQTTGNGILDQYAPGLFRYTPNAGFFGKDSFRVQVSDLGETDYLNSGPALPAEGPLASDQALFTITREPQEADLAVTIKREPDVHRASEQQLGYTITVRNHGEHTARNVVMRDVLSDLVSFNDAGNPTGNYNYDNSSRTLIWEIGSIGKDQQESIRLTAIAKGSGMVSNEASVTGDTKDPNLMNNEAKDIRLLFQSFNVFSPNGDGINDTFIINGVDHYPNELIIKNRKGSEVYRTTNYHNDWNGSNLPPATYYWVLKILNNEGKWEPFTGHITIVR